MRRLTRHAILGTVATTLAAGGVLLVGGPGLLGTAADQGQPTVAVPVTDSDRVPERENRPDRSTERPEVAEATKDRADSRAKELKSQRADIADAAKKAKAAAEKKRREAAAKRAAAERAKYAELGYEKGTTDPREIARQMMEHKFGWGAGEYACYDRLVVSESNWDHTATNPSSGAYGIPQALPASKMASAGSDWQTNPATQIRWGLDYVKDRYGTPCSAWGFKQGNNWY